MQVLVLASGSQYRAQLLSRLGIDFQCVSPDIDESVVAGEAAAELARRLARTKAIAAIELLDNHPLKNDPSGHPGSKAIVIASDQVACAANALLGKPGSVDKACRQLNRMSGQRVEFFTAVHMIDRLTGNVFSALDTTRVEVRELDKHSIARYVATDKPLDCAGSFKVESLGISLFDAIHSQDPTALIGLPMIKVCEGLRSFGVQIP